jgi:hypothetical protein
MSGLHVFDQILLAYYISVVELEGISGQLLANNR